MIRHRQGDQFLLFTQDDHARLSGELASHIGNEQFSRPEPLEAVVAGIGMHDCGWPVHDEEPTLNGRGMPLHVFETPVELSCRVWTESVKRAVQKDAYSGLLVSLHVMALSAIAQSHYADQSKRLEFARELFEINRFQQNQIEIQETLRAKLGLRVDVPLKYGLAPRGTSKEEDLLLFNYQLLKATDRISLCLLCESQPFNSIDNIYPRPGAEAIELQLECVSEWTLRIKPWLFDVEQLEMQIPVRAIPAQTYASEADYQSRYRAAKLESLSLRVVR